MKKLCGILTGSGPFTRALMSALVSLFIVAIAVWFWGTAAAFADGQQSSSTGKDSSLVQGDKDKDKDNDDKDHHDGDHGKDHDHGEECTVCHDRHNFHEISIHCEDVEKFCHDHPGDFRGPCTETPNKNK